MLEQRITHEGLKSFRIIRASTADELQAKVKIQQERWTARSSRVQKLEVVRREQQSRHLDQEKREWLALQVRRELVLERSMIDNLLKDVVDTRSSGGILKLLSSWVQQADEAKDRASRLARSGELESPDSGEGIFDGAEDPLYQDAVRVVLEMGRASTSTLQRRLRLGFGRAARILDMMQREGIIGAPNGNEPREVLRRPEWLHEIEKESR